MQLRCKNLDPADGRFEVLIDPLLSQKAEFFGYPRQQHWMATIIMQCYFFYKIDPEVAVWKVMSAKKLRTCDARRSIHQVIRFYYQQEPSWQ
ncbi:uncharacterized protein CMC5_028580 [Chondromyces crocatus]|uniref:Uncharacterized protein n=1 Tax=Chondromyces crocatus TaxID=52 RepID=A0A0K1EDE8_CHOCO|nr:uncharacterized protein CMC5_028580 [Chondromyces crocatus]